MGSISSPTQKFQNFCLRPPKNEREMHQREKQQSGKKRRRETYDDGEALLTSTVSQGLKADKEKYMPFGRVYEMEEDK